MIRDAMALPRPEGGAVHLLFSLPSPAARVRVIRLPAGQAPASPTDPAARLVFEGDPLRVGAFPFHLRPDPPRDPELYAEVFDLEAFAYSFGDDANAIEGQEWDYYLYALEGGAYSEAVRVRARPQRTARHRLRLEVKPLLYQRLKYHAQDAEGGVFVAMEESLHEGHPFPVVLAKARYVLATRHLGHTRQAEGEELAVTYRAVGEVLILARDPGERDRLARHFRDRLVCDLSLFELLGWEDVKLQGSDVMQDFQDAVFYGHTLALDGEVDGFISHPLPWRVSEGLEVAPED
ncbi:DUF4114 domain-containing protein [Calidithermus chliarophilus]|uniref:DUF4114 domain-containing protein n=1 Tax=Calidithermus chliarophilus TaxID=52023 RepID=UPI0004001DDA|nr:DUF4114 domain-containing protein [Calidithermus chliarophilus]